MTVQIKNIRGDKKPQPTQRYPTISAPPDFTAVMSAAPKKLVKQYTFGNGAHIDKMDHLGPEIILEEVFQEYCAIPEEIDASGAKKMLRENNLLSKKFTTVDVDIIFRKTIANILAGPEESPLRNGVIFEKRINYEVFRSEFIGSVAKMRNLTLDDLLELLKQNYIALNRKRCSEHDHGLAPGNK